MLRDEDGVVAYYEFLRVCRNELLDRKIGISPAVRKHLHAEILHRRAHDSSELFGDLFVDLSCRGRFQDDRIGHDGREQNRSDVPRNLNRVLHELQRDDGGRRADRHIHEEDGLRRGNIADAMMVDDLDDLGFIDAVSLPGCVRYDQRG